MHMKHMAFIFLVLLTFQCRQKEENYLTQFPGKSEGTSSLLKEHRNLLSQMQPLTSYTDSTGQVAITLYELMQHHFSEEENYVLPPLAALPLLVSGQSQQQTEELLLLTEKFKTQLSHINAEHQMIKVLLEELNQIAARDGHPMPVGFEEDLHRHAQMEEEIFFPASILVGEYLKLQHVKKK